MKAYFILWALVFIALTGAIRINEGVAPAAMVFISIFAIFFIIFELTNIGTSRRR